MNINAQFSEIFQLKVFGEINEYEKSFFVSWYHFPSMCRFCQIELRAVNGFHGSQHFLGLSSHSKIKHPIQKSLLLKNCLKAVS